VGCGNNLFTELAQPSKRLAFWILLRIALIPADFFQEHANLALIEGCVRPRKYVDQHGVCASVGLEETSF
jgi:hypothetical protein